ncbi:MAG TPA: hypothetical protein VNO31_15480 [Umezawaea sp.]|nr:hypothetical protein [Umezawaea sp.]
MSDDINDAVRRRLMADAMRQFADLTIQTPDSLLGQVPPPSPVDPVAMLREVDRLIDRLPIVVCSAEDEQRVRASIPWNAPMRVQVDNVFAKPGTAYVINPEGLPWIT